MLVTDFEFDGKLLSEMGYMIGYSDGAPESITNGSEITLNTLSLQNGLRYELVDTTYAECLTTTFNIYKNPCVFDDEYIFSMEEIREIMRWLNRKGFYLFRFMDDDYVNIEFNATFTNVNREFCGGNVIGLELTLQTDKPFAYGRAIVKEHVSEEPNWSFVVGCDSDEESNIYPKMEITMLADGDLTIKNSFDGQITVIKGCVTGEVIYLDYPMISQKDGGDHDIPNCFNWNWFRIGTDFRHRRNNVSVNLPCKIKMTYAPIVKMGLL